MIACLQCGRELAAGHKCLACGLRYLPLDDRKVVPLDEPLAEHNLNHYRPFVVLDTTLRQE
jgi:hypothetical protein